MNVILKKSLCFCPVLKKEIPIVKLKPGIAKTTVDANCYKDFILALALSKSCSPLERCL